MYKKTLLLLILIVIILLLPKNKYYVEYTRDNYIDKKGRWIIEVSNINISGVVTLSNIKSNNIKGIVLFEDYGRPNIKYSNTIIGAHSGNGKNSYFNDIDKLEINDEIVFYYQEVEYKYFVINVFEVRETDLSVLLPIQNKTTITLITCNKFNPRNRIVVVGELR